MRNVIYDAIREANFFIKWYSVFEIRFSFPLGMCPAGSHGRSVLNFLRNLHIIFSSGWTKLPSHQQCVSVPFFPTTSSPTPLLSGLDSLDSHSEGCEVICNSDFDLHSPDNQWCWASFHVPIGHFVVLWENVYIVLLSTF